MTAMHDHRSTGAGAHDVVTAGPRPGATSARWSAEDLALLERTGEVRIAATRTGTDAPPRSTPIWIVVHDDEAYIRAYTGASSRWFRAVAPRGAGVLTVGSRTFDVQLEPADPGVADGIDAGYRVKYGDSSYVRAMTTTGARAAALRVRPIETDRRR
jgi:hypothetical protein